MLNVVLVLLVVVVGFVLYVRYWHKRPSTPRGYVERAPVPLPKIADVTKDNFVKTKIPEELDAIIIGSGISALMTACLLSKIGKKVLVLEQHYVAGGSTHCFEDKGWEFDTGLHYVGRVEKYGELINLVADHRVEWEKLGSEEDGFGYDRVVIGPKGEEIDFLFPSGKEILKEKLEKMFPKEVEGINRYFSIVEEMNKKSGEFFEFKLLGETLNSILSSLTLSRYKELAKKSPVEVVNSCVSDPKLRAIFLAQFGDYGGSPDKASFVIQAGVSSHYYNGAYYPVGGTESIAKAMIPTILKAGGRVLVRAKVDKILVNEQTMKVEGVSMEKSGFQIRAPMVISAAGAIGTCSLLSPTLLPKMKIQKVLKEAKQSMCHVIAFIGLRGSSAELNVPSHNIWYLPCEKDYDMVKMCENYYKNPSDTPQIAFVGFPSAKDPKYEERYPNKTTCCIVTEARYEWFEEYKNERVRHRSSNYQSLKEEFSGRLLDILFHLHPHLKDKVEYVDVSTPLSSEFYLASPQGSSYGLEHSPKRYTEMDYLKPTTEVDGFFLTGQDVATCGIAGALMGGVLTSLAITGYPTLFDIATKRNLIEDIMMMEKKKKEKKE